MTAYTPARRPTRYFIGVTTGRRQIISETKWSH